MPVDSGKVRTTTFTAKETHNNDSLGAFQNTPQSSRSCFSTFNPLNYTPGLAACLSQGTRVSVSVIYIHALLVLSPNIRLRLTASEQCTFRTCLLLTGGFVSGLRRNGFTAQCSKMMNWKSWLLTEDMRPRIWSY